MLSKSSARRFFIGGTTVFSLVFLGLTVDTIRQVPARSNADKMSESVKRGHDLWTDNNCMGCHTLLGEGAYYAPELTKVVERRGREWIKVFIKDPQAMFPGKRKMVQYPFEPEEIDAIIDFLEWVGHIDTNGFPPKPDLAPISASNAPPAPIDSPTAYRLANAPSMFTTICMSCHAVGGKGGIVGPALDGVGDRFSSADLSLWLKDPQKVKPGTAMPNLNLNEETLQEMVQFLSSMKKGESQ